MGKVKLTMEYYGPYAIRVLEIVCGREEEPNVL